MVAQLLETLHQDSLHESTVVLARQHSIREVTQLAAQVVTVVTVDFRMVVQMVNGMMLQHGIK